MASKPVFVIAAEVAAELNRGMLIAKRLLLVASNARALALRAGESAAGFRPITDSIDDLVKVTLETSQTINVKAQNLSKMEIGRA
ncbi:chemotaxis protein, partial [Vibrio genomosp. F10 str. 9ZD137]